MVIFNKCYIDDINKKLIIEASVEDSIYYENVYIDSVIIDTDQEYSDNGPINTPLDKSLTKIEENTKSIKLELTPRNIGVDSLDNHIFYVYIKQKGVPTSDCPCGGDQEYYVQPIFNERPFYNEGMNYIKELNSSCCVPRNFIDLFLRIKALDMSLKTKNFINANILWKQFVNKSISSPLKSCNCNGHT